MRTFWRHEDTWAAGWQWGDFWLSVHRGRDLTAVDLGKWRIRWTGPKFRPLFSERYGYQKWHRAGRLSWRRYETRGLTTPPGAPQ